MPRNFISLYGSSGDILPAAGGGGAGNASLIDVNSFYPATTGSLAAASVNDVIVLACMNSNGSHATATCAGATCVLTEPSGGFIAVTGTNTEAITLLTGLVTGAGTPAFTTSADTDTGFIAWLVRGISSATPIVVNTAGGVGNPLTAAGNPAAKSCLFIAWFSENADNYTSFNMSIVEDAHNTSHFHAGGHLLNLAASSYTPGANNTSSADNAVAFLFLQNT